MALTKDRPFLYKGKKYFEFERCHLRWIPKVLNDELKTINDETLGIKFNQSRFIISAIQLLIDEYHKRNNETGEKENEISI